MQATTPRGVERKVGGKVCLFPLRALAYSGRQPLFNKHNRPQTPFRAVRWAARMDRDLSAKIVLVLERNRTINGFQKWSYTAQG